MTDPAIDLIEAQEALIERGQALIARYSAHEGLEKDELIKQLAVLLDGPDQRALKEQVDAVLGRRSLVGEVVL